MTTRKATLKNQGSQLVAALERAYADVRKRNPGLPEQVLFITGTGRKRGSLKWGHFGPERWKTDPSLISEIFIGGERLHTGPELTFQTLLHEAAHAWAHQDGVSDTSRGHKYHNKRFVEYANKLGLVWPEGEHPHPSIGYSAVVLADETKDTYAGTIKALGEAITATLPAPELVLTGKVVGAPATPDRNNSKAVCGCGRIIRVSKSTIADGAITCALCGQDFEVAA